MDDGLVTAVQFRQLVNELSADGARIESQSNLFQGKPRKFKWLREELLAVWAYLRYRQAEDSE